MTTKRSCVEPAQVMRRLSPGCSTATTPGSTATPWRGWGTGSSQKTWQRRCSWKSRSGCLGSGARRWSSPPGSSPTPATTSPISAAPGGPAAFSRPPICPDRPAPDDPASAAILRLDVARLKAALDRLTDDQRDVVMLRYAAGLGNDETARVLGKPVSAVKSLHHRAIGALRRAMDDAQPPAPDDGGVA